MMADSFLSIDLDYWTRGRRHRCNAFFKKVYALGLPIHAAYEHDHLLDVINSSQCTTLINVDWHSDLCETPEGGYTPEDLNEGTWGNFVSWKEHGTFIWRYPSLDCLGGHSNGYCHDYENPFEQPVSGWQRAMMRQGVAGIPWDSVKAVGVCLSPCWIGLESVIREPIDHLGMRQWLEVVHHGARLIHPDVITTPPSRKRTGKSRKLLANR